jgi:hypothetical protein
MRKKQPAAHTIERVKLDDIKPAPYNPRSISAEAKRGLLASIRRFGLVQPLIVNRRSGLLVGGHQRLEALRESGATDADVLFVDLPDAEERALNVSLNSDRIAGEFTDDLGDVLSGLDVKLGDDFAELRLDELGVDKPAESDWAVALGGASGAATRDVMQMTFVLTNEQAETVKRAIAAKHESGLDADPANANRNGNALAAICLEWIGG